MRLLVLGGTVFLGRHVVEAALSRGHEVTLFNRGQTRPDLFPEVERLKGDRNADLAALEGRTWDAVFDPSAFLPRQVRATAAALSGSVGHYTFVSSISVYPIEQSDKSETAPGATIQDPESDDVTAGYGALKALCEGALDEALPGRVLNVRAGLLIGPHDPSNRFTYWPVRVARGGEVLAPGDPEAPCQIIDARDVAEWVLDMAAKAATGTFNVTGPAEPVPLRRVLETCREVSRSDARFTWVDSEFLQEQGVGPWLEMPLWLPANLGSLVAPTDRVLARGIRYRTLDSTVRETLEWAQAEPVPVQQLDAGGRQRPLGGLAPEKEAAVLQAWHSRARAAS
jgi:2'-hydroxyisoflavone reductase